MWQQKAHSHEVSIKRMTRTETMRHAIYDTVNVYIDFV